MLSYLCDLMEDANDFSWASAKASHAVLLCEMERGTLEWANTERIDRIRRAHAQRHNPGNKQNWAQNQDPQRKPWFCKSYQGARVLIMQIMSLMARPRDIFVPTVSLRDEI